MASTPTMKYTTKLHAQRYCVAEAALEYGAHVIISGSNEPKVSRILARLRDTPGGKLEGSKVSGKACDLSDADHLEENLDSLLRFATDNGTNKLDHVVFTAGDAVAITPVSDITPDKVNKAMVVRFIGPLILAKLLPRYIQPTFRSSLTLTGGTNSAKPAANWTLAAGVGSGIEGLARGLAVDLKPVRVNLVSLGAVHTEIFGSLPQENLEAVLEGFRRATLTGTVGRPEDAAESYLYVMRDYLVDGTVISTDGGRLLA